MRLSTSLHARVLAGAFGLLATGLVPLTASALPRFPGEIAEDVQGDVLPACSVCHLGGKTSGITTVTPFVLALKERGFSGEGDTLGPALTKLEADGIDSDGDGVGDVAELRAGTDPNSPVPQAPSAEPSYGCNVSGRQHERGLSLSVAAMVGLVLGGLVSQRRRSRTRALSSSARSSGASPSSTSTAP